MRGSKERGLERLRWLAAPVLAAYAWAATSLRPFTNPALAVTLLTGVLITLLGAKVRKRRTTEPVASQSVAWWLLLFGALAAWEMAAFVQLPRADHPTLSSLANQVFDSHLVRALAFTAWMAAGFGIARR